MNADFGVGILFGPFSLLLFFGLIVIPIEMFLAWIIPDCRVKRFLFDRTIRDKRPAVWMAYWFLFVGILWAFIGWLISIGPPY